MRGWVQGLRNLLYLVSQFVLTIFYGLVVLCSAPLPAKLRFRIVQQWTGLMVELARIICGVRYRVIGRENLPDQPGYIIASKHSSTWETVAIATWFGPASFVAKRELLWLPFFGWGFALASPITINRSAGAQAMAQMIEQGEQRLRDGFNIVIFPEGTRIPFPQPGKYKTGCARLALGVAADGVPIKIVPMAHDAGRLWPKHPITKRPGVVTLSILPPIDPTQFQGEGASARLTDAIERVIETEVARLNATAGAA